MNEPLGGRIYQTRPGVVVDVAAAALWAARQQPPPGITLVPLDDVAPARAADAWAAYYRTVHETWSPVGEEAAVAVADMAADECAGADPELSVLAVRGDRIVAGAWVYESDGDDYELVGETLRRDEPGGASILAAVLAECLRRAGGIGVRRIEIDGYGSDPHLTAIAQGLPGRQSDPVLLGELG